MTSKQIEPATDEQIAIVQDMDHPLVQSLISRVKIEVAAREELENDVSFWKEQAFFAGGGRRWICTMKCAKHLFPDAPGHSNQVLRYHMKLDQDFDDAERAMPPHRAGPDTFVTAHRLARMVFAKSVDESALSSTKPPKPPLTKVMPHRSLYQDRSS